MSTKNVTMLNKNLFLLRSIYEMSKVSFGKSLGVSGQYISMLESGANKRVGQTVSMQIERIYHVSPEWLLTGEVNENYIYEITHAIQSTLSTAEALAKKLSVPVAFVNAVLAGEISPSTEFFRRAVLATGTEPHGRFKDAVAQGVKDRDQGGEKHPDLLRYRISILEQNVEVLEEALSEEKYKNERLVKENEELKKQLDEK